MRLDALQTEKNKLQSVIDSIGIGLSIQDKDYNILFQNEPSKAATGDNLGKKCYHAYAFKDDICEGCPVAKAFKDGKSHSAEKTRVEPSGRVTFWENTASPIRDAGGNIVSCLEITRDITERKRAEQALADEATRRRILVDQSLDGIVVLDQNGKVYEANRQFAEMLGYTPEEAAELHVWDWDTQWTHEQLLGMIQSVDAAGDHFETYHRRKDGTTIDVEISTNGAMCAGQKLVFCVCRDFTKRKQMEELFETVTNSSPVGIYIVQNGKFILANPRFQKLTGYSEEELLGMNSLTLVLPEDREAVRKKAIKMLKGKRSSTYQFRVVKKNGNIRWVMETVTSIQYRGRRAILGNYMDITERRQTEEKVQRQNEFLNNILDALTHPFYVLDASDYTIKMGNLATKAGDLAENPTCYALTHHSDQPCRGTNHICPLREVKKTKKPAVVEHIHYDQDGNARNIEVHGYPIFNAKGHVVQMIEYSLDITERKRAEEALKESEEFRSSLLANSPNPIGVINPDSSLRYVNPALEKLTGFPAAELIGKKAPYPYWTQEKLKKTILSFRKAMRQGDLRAEELFQKKNGERFWVKITSTPVMNNGEFKYLLTNWVDITKRKQVEEALRQSEKKYKNLAEATSDLIWEADERGMFTFVSPMIKDILGYEASEVVGKKRTLDLVPKAEVREWLKHFREINAKREQFSGFEITHLHKNGTPILFEVSGIPTFDNKGNFMGYVGINKDITERKRMEEQLMLTDRLASIGELASGIAHELNNPLTSVIGFSQLLLEEDIPQNLKEDLGTIYSEAQRASAIVKNLLTFARKHAPMRQLSQVNNILEDVLKLRAYEHRVNNIELEKHFAADLPEIMVDYFQMQQVFLNIIVNAETAMLEASGRGKLVITTGRFNNTVKVTIADNGPGIAKENLRRVFDPFFTTKEVGKGTGLGLSICHGIVTGHGGKIYAESEIKKGANFVMELPVNGNAGVRRDSYVKR
jgi:two-component system NtrC family sensor kinase